MIPGNDMKQQKAEGIVHEGAAPGARCARIYHGSVSLEEWALHFERFLTVTQ